MTPPQGPGGENGERFTITISRRAALWAGAVAVLLVVSVIGFTLGRITSLHTNEVSQTSPTMRPAPSAGSVSQVIASHAATTAPAAAPAPTLAAAVPRVVVCSGSPQYEPSSLHWCTSACSSYMTGIAWRSWTSQSATGVGTLMTNDGEPNCVQGTWTAHPTSVVNLSEPEATAYCGDSGKATALLFTATDLWSGVSLPGVPCP